MAIYKHDGDTIEEIETAASALADIREQRKELAAREKDAAEAVALEMKRAGIVFYVAAGGLKVELDTTEKIKTKRIG